MTNKKTAAYCVLLSMLILIGTVFAFAGEAQARYNNTIFCSTVLETAKTEIKSNVLVKNSEAPVTVLIGEVSEEKTVGFWIKAFGTEAKEKISWESDSEYISVEFETGGTKIESGTEVLLSKDTETEVLMRIIPSGKNSSAVCAKISVTVGELCGTFEADIPAVESTEDENEGSTDIPAEDQTGNSGGDAPTVETGSGEGEGSSGGTAEEAETAESSGTEGLKTLPRFEPKGKLPVKMVIPDGATSVKIGFYENGAIVPFPEGTRISLDEGGKFYSVYGGRVAEFDLSKFLITDSGYSVLLDFGNAEIGETAEILIAAEAFSGTEKIGTYIVSSVPDVVDAGKTEVDFAVEELDIGINENEAEKILDYYILSEGDSLLMKFPKEWIEEEESSLRCSVQILALAGNDAIVYNDVDFFKESLWASYTVDEENCNLTLDIGEVLPSAGTYQAYIRWEFSGICFYKKQITFFINYSTDIYSTLES